ncbi:MAG: hypothetical protein RMJ48_10585 [Roseiflexaceae bacterium]|nr:hypothetical protein [Roseiflexaceae bacterium]
MRRNWRYSSRGRDVLDEAAIYIAQARAAFHELGALAPLASLQAIELYCMLRRGQAARAAAAASAFVRRLDEVEGAAPDLRLRLLLAVVLGEAGEHQQALDLLKTTVQQMQHRGYRVFLASACLYGAYLAGRCNNAALRDAWLRTGWAVAEEERCRFLPMLPVEALKDVAVAALRAGIKAEAVGRILPRHLDEEAVEMFQDVSERSIARSAGAGSAVAWRCRCGGRLSGIAHLAQGSQRDGAPDR